MKILGIDFGLNNFGLAISDGVLAEPLRQIKVSFPQQAISKLRSICQKNQVQKIVIGLPEGRLVEKIKEFGKELKQAVNIPVVFQDETLTSKKATEKMIEAQKPLKKRRKEKHVFSACLILQDYLDQLENT